MWGREMTQNPCRTLYVCVLCMYASTLKQKPSDLSSLNLAGGRWAASRTLFSYENLGSTAREFSRKCETPRCENSTLAIICPLLLINGIDVTILWAELAKRSKEISCSRNLVAARDFYDARRTFYASSYENLVERKCETRLW